LAFPAFVTPDKNSDHPAAYLTQTLNARVELVLRPNAPPSMYEAKEQRATLPWTDGLQSLPAH